MKVCFVASGPIEWGSSRMRCYWIAPYMDDATVVRFSDELPPADVYIWQKQVDLSWIEQLPNARHYWDICDPLHWFDPDIIREWLPYLDGIVASNEGLASDLEEWCGMDVSVIPDRLELEHFPKQRKHKDVNPVRFIWFGVAVNRIALNGAIANLDRLAANGHEIELTVMDERPDVAYKPTNRFPIYHVRWELDKENEIIAAHDIALLPPYPGPWGKVKSNNKDLTAFACGIPRTVADYYPDLVLLVQDAELRQFIVNEREDESLQYPDVPELRTWHVRNSAAEWNELLNADGYVDLLKLPDLELIED